MTPRFFRLWCVASSLGATVLSAQQPEAGQPPGPTAQRPAPLGLLKSISDEPVTMRIPSADLVTALKLVEQWTGRTVLRPAGLPPVDGINLEVSKPIPQSEALQALETVLSLNQIALIPVGDKFVKVVPLGMARMEAPPLIEGSTLDLPPSGAVATKIFQLQFMRVEEFNQVASAQILNPNMGAVVMAMKANAIMITDTISSLQRIETLINKLDQPALAGMMPKFYPLKAAKASDVVNKLTGILSGTAQQTLGANTRYTADDRTNQIILMSDPRQYAIFDELIAKLDVRSDPNTKHEVIPLKHANAEEVGTLISTLISGQNQAKQQTGSVRPGQALPPRAPGAPEGAPQPNPTVAGAPDLGNTNEFSSLLSVQPDKRANSIVVAGTVDDIRLIRELIAKIDTQLAQVRIEVIIAEVTLNDSDVSGLDALSVTFGEHGGDPVLGGGVTRILKADGLIGGLKFETIPNPLTLIAQLQNMGEKRNVKVLSTPMIMTTHAKTGNIKVGEEVPYTGSSGYGGSQLQANQTGGVTNPALAGSYAGPIAQAQFKPIVIDLKVTPLIGEDGSIQLEVDQIVDDNLGKANLGSGIGEVPIVGTRHAKSWVNVQDGHMVVLGGLQRTKDTKGRAKLGFFWELPGISHLFGKRTKDSTRTELLLFIRPTIVPPHKSTADTTRAIENLSNKDQINSFLNTSQQQPPPATTPPPSPKSGNSRAGTVSRRK